LLEPTPNNRHTMVAYSRVPQNDGGVKSAYADREEKKKIHSRKMERINNKIHAFLWCVGAALTIYYTDFFRVLLENKNVDRFYFNIAVVAFGINTCITLYLAIWLPYVQKIDLEWEVYCPRMIPTATIVGLICAFCSVMGLWPVWGFLTPLILTVVFVGALMSAHFLPSI